MVLEHFSEKCVYMFIERQPHPYKVIDMKHDDCEMTLTVLSDWMEGKVPAESDVAKHITTCPICQAKIAKLKKVDHLTHEYLTAQVPQMQTHLAVQAIRRKMMAQQEAQSVFVFRRYMFQVAASVVLLLAVGATAIRFLSTPNDDVVNTPPSIEAVSDVAEVKELPKIESPRANVFLEDVQPVSFSYGIKLIESQNYIKPIIEDALPVCATIEPQVSHLWVIGKYTELNAYLLYARRNFTVSVLKPENGVACIEVKGSTRNVVDLVRRFNMMGAKLVSSSSPQPEDVCFTNDAESQITYRAEFVLDEESTPLAP